MQYLIYLVSVAETQSYLAGLLYCSMFYHVIYIGDKCASVAVVDSTAGIYFFMYGSVTLQCVAVIICSHKLEEVTGERCTSAA